jgi:hypothetical protein
MTTQAIPQPSTAFDAKLFEKRCETYLQFRSDQENAKQDADDLKVWILAQVQQHGFVPTNAEKSRRLEAIGHVATVTTGTTVEIDDQLCTELELLLAKARCPKMFPALFTRRSEYSLAKTAAVAIKATPWPKKFKADIVTLYARCFSPKPKTPSLEVESRAAIAERDRIAAEKAAAKTTKKPGRKAAA